MKAIIKELGFETLPTLNEFRKAKFTKVLFDIHSHCHYKWAIEEVNAYGDLIDQPFALGQFIPCDKDGKPMDKPQMSQFPGYKLHEDMFQSKVLEYQQAVDAVIFEGWELGVYNLPTNTILYNGNSRIQFVNGECNTWEHLGGGCITVPVLRKTIESYINSGGKLTLKK